MSPKSVMSPKSCRRWVRYHRHHRCCFEARKGRFVTLIDSDNRVGGLLKSDFCNGQYFDYGTHILSETSNKELNNFLFSELDSDNCILADKIETYCYFNGEINFKNACMDINTLPQELYLQACYELITAAETDVSNLESFFISRFGKTIYEAVFKDVVKKYFGMDANLLSEKMGYFFDMSDAAFDAQTTRELTKIGAFNRKLGHHIRKVAQSNIILKLVGLGGLSGFWQRRWRRRG